MHISQPTCSALKLLHVCLLKRFIAPAWLTYLITLSIDLDCFWPIHPVLYASNLCGVSICHVLVLDLNCSGL